MTNIDRKHGAIVNTVVTEAAWIWIHADGYKEVVYKEDMETQEIQYAE